MVLQENVTPDDLTVTISRFKSTGKWCEDFDLYIPRSLPIYDARIFLNEEIERLFPNSYETSHWVSLDSNVLGFPFMLAATKGWYDE